MKNVISLALITVLLFSTLLYAAEQWDQKQHPICNFCGMNRVKFPTVRMLLAYKDQEAVATCSLHCTACALSLSFDNQPTTIKASDFNSHQLIDAKTATWVVGGEKPGVMTSRAKWAFGDRNAAEQFVNAYGGNIVDFEQALEAAVADNSKDTLLLHKRGKKKQI